MAANFLTARIDAWHAGLRCLLSLRLMRSRNFSVLPFICFLYLGLFTRCSYFSFFGNLSRLGWQAW